MPRLINIFKLDVWDLSHDWRGCCDTMAPALCCILTILMGLLYLFHCSSTQAFLHILCAECIHSGIHRTIEASTDIWYRPGVQRGLKSSAYNIWAWMIKLFIDRIFARWQTQLWRLGMESPIWNVASNSIKWLYNSVDIWCCLDWSFYIYNNKISKVLSRFYVFICLYWKTHVSNFIIEKEIISFKHRSLS